MPPLVQASGETGPMLSTVAWGLYVVGPVIMESRELARWGIFVAGEDINELVSLPPERDVRQIVAVTTVCMGALCEWTSSNTVHCSC
jgi:hypothetical protein